MRREQFTNKSTKTDTFPSSRAPDRWKVQAEVLAALIRAGAILRFRPANHRVEASSVPIAEPRPARWREVHYLAATTRRLASVIPSRAPRFQRALAVQWLLRRRGYDAVLHFGARMRDDELQTHAWVTLDGDAVIGRTDSGSFAELQASPT